MKPDLNYISRLLNVFIEAETADITLNDIEQAGIQTVNGTKMDELFVFHIQLAFDNSLVATRHGPATSLRDIGVKEFGSGNAYFTNKRVRLTQSGHDFATALGNKEILQKLQSELKDAPFKVIFEGSQKLLQHYMKKRLEGLLAGGA